MKAFDISDVLSVTTGRLVSSRHMDGIYDILNFLTGDSLDTHQLPRAMEECEPWLRTTFPQLFGDNPVIQKALSELDGLMDESDDRPERGAKIAEWVEVLRGRLNLPASLPVYEMGADMHTHSDPVEEAQAMAGDKRVIALDLGS